MGYRGVRVTNDEEDNLTVVPLPSSESEEERERVRESNDRDQQLEREGIAAPHNVGYDEAADGVRKPEGGRPGDE
jgi:hypothetical protein